MVYRGADQPDMSIINPESDVWQHIKVSVLGAIINPTQLLFRYLYRILLRIGQSNMPASVMMVAC